jgi:hypothetical protein
MQRAQPDDRARHAGFRQDPLTRKREAEAQPVVYSHTNATLMSTFCETALSDELSSGSKRATAASLNFLLNVSSTNFCMCIIPRRSKSQIF